MGFKVDRVALQVPNILQCTTAKVDNFFGRVSYGSEMVKSVLKNNLSDI